MDLRGSLFTLVAVLALVALTACKTAETTVGKQPPPPTANIWRVGPLYEMPPETVQTRWYTFENPQAVKGGAGKAKFGRKGAAVDVVRPGQTMVWADIQGSGTIRRMWSTMGLPNAKKLRGLRIEMYWDGANKPAVQAPFGDFFGHSLGHLCKFENDCFSSPEGRSLNCFLPMLFRNGARIQVVNDTDEEAWLFYEVDCTVGERHGPNTLYFHSAWRRENPTQLRRDMTILPRIEGRGRFLGSHLGGRANASLRHISWGEGEVTVYLDGDQEYPTLCGTGTEDYVGTAYGQGYFHNRSQGNPFVSAGGQPPFQHASGFYRFHIPDPLYFHRDIRVTIQVMGGGTYVQMLEALRKDPALCLMKTTDGTQYFTREELEANPKAGNTFERVDDVCATAYWYMNRRDDDLPPLAPVGERLADLP
jgi:hypothetical protein